MEKGGRRREEGRGLIYRCVAGMEGERKAKIWCKGGKRGRNI